MTDKFEPRILDTISCFSYNKDCSKIAISASNNIIYIYNTNGNKNNGWILEATLQEHDSYVSGLDWSPVTNLIVSCSHDRNAYVWQVDNNNIWHPTLVILRINRAATSCKWSPDGKKFAVTSGAKCVPICHYEASNDWWISKMIKSHKSSVLCLDWCPNSKFIITGGTDKRCRIFSAFIDTVDSTDDASVFQNVFPNQFNFGEVLHEFEFNQAWINSVAWSPDMFRIAFAAHNSTISFGQIFEGVPPVSQTLRITGLPLTSITFLTNDTVIGVGYDCTPLAYAADGNGNWKFVDRVDKEKKAEVKAVQSGVANARAMFQGASSHGLTIKDNAGAVSSEVGLKTRHQNTIGGISKFSATKFSTCGSDGRVLQWDLEAIDVDLAALKLK